jgi:hypothetical protein
MKAAKARKEGRSGRKAGIKDGRKMNAATARKDGRMEGTFGPFPRARGPILRVDGPRALERKGGKERKERKEGRKECKGKEGRKGMQTPQEARQRRKERGMVK